MNNLHADRLYPTRSGDPCKSESKRIEARLAQGPGTAFEQLRRRYSKPF